MWKLQDLESAVIWSEKERCLVTVGKIDQMRQTKYAAHLGKRQRNWPNMLDVPKMLYVRKRVAVIIPVLCRMTQAFSGVCDVCDFVCLSVYDKTKTDETTITKLATITSPHPLINFRSKDQLKGQGRKATKCKNLNQGDRVSCVSYTRLSSDD